MLKMVTGTDISSLLQRRVSHVLGEGIWQHGCSLCQLSVSSYQYIVFLVHLILGCLQSLGSRTSHSSARPQESVASRQVNQAYISLILSPCKCTALKHSQLREASKRPSCHRRGLYLPSYPPILLVRMQSPTARYCQTLVAISKDHDLRLSVTIELYSPAAYRER